MSIEYTLFKDDDPAKAVVYSTSFSNIHHTDWQGAINLSRTMRNNATGIEESWPVHTTIHDDDRVCFTIDWIERFLQSNDCVDGPLAEHLTEVVDAAINNYCTLVFV